MAEGNDRAPSYGQCFASLALGLAPFCLIMGIAAVFGSNTVTWNGQNVYGLPALLVAAGLDLLFAAILAGLQKLGFWMMAVVTRRRAASKA